MLSTEDQRETENVEQQSLLGGTQKFGLVHVDGWHPFMGVGGGTGGGAIRSNHEEVNGNKNDSGTSVDSSTTSDHSHNTAGKPDQETASCSTENDDSTFYPSFTWSMAGPQYVKKVDKEEVAVAEPLEKLVENDDSSFFTAVSWGLAEEDKEEDCSDDVNLAVVTGATDKGGSHENETSSDDNDTAEKNNLTNKFRTMFGNFWSQGDKEESPLGSMVDTFSKKILDRIQCETEVQRWVHQQQQQEKGTELTDEEQKSCDSGQETGKPGNIPPQPVEIPHAPVVEEEWASEGGYLMGAHHENDNDESFYEGTDKEEESPKAHNENGPKPFRSIFGHFWDPKDEPQEPEQDNVPLEDEIEQQAEESEDEHEEEQQDNLGEFRSIFGKGLSRRESSVYRSLSDMAKIEPQHRMVELEKEDNDDSDCVSVTSVSSATRRSIFGPDVFSQPNAPPAAVPAGSWNPPKRSSSLLRSFRYSGEFRRVKSASDMDGMKRSVSFSEETKVELYEKDMEQYADDNWADMFS